MDRVKELFSLIAGSHLLVEGQDTFVKVPMWLTVLAALSSWKLAILSALLIVAFGMRVRIIKA